MLKFIGVKEVLATPMNRRDYNAFRGWTMPENEDGGDEGMLVEYADGGYQTWSPLDVFERAYRRIDALTFGLAIEAMKLGRKVSRAGWNGRGMHLYLVGPGRYPPSTPAGEEIARSQTDGLVPYAPYIAMLTVDGIVVPWLASQTDVLAEDWAIISD